MEPRLQPSSTLKRLLLSSPVGPLLVEHDGEAVRAIHYWEQGKHPPAGTRVEPTRDDALGWRIAEQLRDYFTGKRRDFDLPLAPEGTEFRQRVWEALRSIPFGETRSYRDVAAQVGIPRRFAGDRAGEPAQPRPHRHPLPPRGRHRRHRRLFRRRPRGEEGRHQALAPAPRGGGGRLDAIAAPGTLDSSVSKCFGLSLVDAKPAPSPDSEHDRNRSLHARAKPQPC